MSARAEISRPKPVPIYRETNSYRPSPNEKKKYWSVIKVKVSAQTVKKNIRYPADIKARNMA